MDFEEEAWEHEGGDGGQQPRVRPPHPLARCPAHARRHRRQVEDSPEGYRLANRARVCAPDAAEPADNGKKEQVEEPGVARRVKPTAVQRQGERGVCRCGRDSEGEVEAREQLRAK